MPTPRLATLIVRWRAPIAVAWGAAAAVLLPEARRVGEVLEVAARVDGSESAAVERIMRGPLGSLYARFAVLVVGGIASPATPEGAAVLGRIVRAVGQAPGVGGTVSYLDGGDSLFLAPQGRGTFVVVGLVANTATPDRAIPPLRALAARLAEELQPDHPGITLRWTGEGPLNVDLRRTSGRDVGQAERRALPLTAAFLLVAFGALAAALLPVMAGAVSIAVALGAAAFIARAWPLAILLQSVVTMLGLGLGIDYALLMVSRFREGLAAGRHQVAAAEDAARHAGHTILLSAAAVAVGFVALLVVPLNEMRAIAVGGLLVVLTSALLATTLVPGILAWAGPRIDWGRLHRRDGTVPSMNRWRRLGRAVLAHPWWALAGGGIPLMVLAAQAGRLQTGLPRGDWLPATMESALALRDLRAVGRGGVINTLRVVVVLPPGTSARRSAGWNAIRNVADTLASDPRVERVHSVIDVAKAAGLGRSALAFLPDSAVRGLVSPDAMLALIEVMPRDSVSPDGLVGVVGDVRRRGAAMTGLPGARALVGGLPAFNADYHDAVAGQFTRIALLVLVGTLVSLFIGTRSLLVPLKAIALNLLSVAGAFGALTLVFQLGHGARLFGVTEPLGAVFSTLPVVVFCMVFGLSMDYEVFLITRIMEARNNGMEHGDAIVEGMATTGPVITSAAAIMLVVFGAFTLGGFLMVKMLGFTLAAAVLIDATVVRMVIGPALLQLAGHWNWWPGGLSRRESGQIPCAGSAGRLTA